MLEIHYISEAKVGFSCPIDYKNFPFHKATCKMKITSMVHFQDSMRFEAEESLIPDIFLRNSRPQPQTRGYDVSVRYLTGDDTSGVGFFMDGTFSIAGIQIELEGKYVQYIYNYFLPTTMFTVTSWFSYLLPPASYPARTSLLVTIFLCQIGIFTSAIKDTPGSDHGNNGLINM